MQDVQVRMQDVKVRMQDVQVRKHDVQVRKQDVILALISFHKKRIFFRLSEIWNIFSRNMIKVHIMKW
jgi:hypothetical protein